jgi:hypothetical protein
VRKNWDSLLRADLVCMAALYYLVFVEFLFPQSTFDLVARDNDSVTLAIRVVLASLAAMAIGRHFVPARVKRFDFIGMQMPPSSLILLFWICFAVGFFHMLMGVDFDPIEMVDYFLQPRFDAPWGREQFGDLSTLIYELGATIYLVPPLAGVILGNRRVHKTRNLIPVFLGLIFTLFYGFSTGTRSIMGAYLITFLVAYFYSSSRSLRSIAPIAAAAALLMLASTFYGLEFRTMGLKNYINAPDYDYGQVSQGFYVDYNLYTISELVAIFPATYPYLGWEVPEWLLVRIVPRALWPGKPTGEAISAQTYLTVPESTTVSSTFIGESYMSAGILSVIIVSLALGYLTIWWTKKTFSVDSDFGILYYGSGFFAVVTTMRSLYMLPVALLPSLALAALAYAIVARRVFVQQIR